MCVPPKCAVLVRTETTFLFAWDLHEYSTTYETRIRLGWNNPAISCFHTTQSIFAAECGDCFFLETKAFGDGGVVDPLHTHGGDMFFLLSCHVSSGLVLGNRCGVMLVFRIMIPLQHHAKLLPVHRTVQPQIPTLVSLENPVPQCPVHRILCPVRGSVVQRRVGKQLRDLFRQITKPTVEPVTRTGLVRKPSVDGEHHLVRLRSVAERFLLVSKPE